MDDKSQQRRVWSHHSGSTAHKLQVRSNRGPLGAVKIAGSREKRLLPSIPAIMAWCADWEARKEALLKVGLPVLARGVELTDGFLSITLDADQACLLRSHAARGFDLHISLGYMQDYDSPLDAMDTALRLHHRWAGQWALLNIAWIGSGGPLSSTDTTCYTRTRTSSTSTAAADTGSAGRMCPYEPGPRPPRVTARIAGWENECLRPQAVGIRGAPCGSGASMPDCRCVRMADRGSGSCS